MKFVLNFVNKIYLIGSILRVPAKDLNDICHVWNSSRQITRRKSKLFTGNLSRPPTQTLRTKPSISSRPKLSTSLARTLKPPGVIIDRIQRKFNFIDHYCLMCSIAYSINSRNTLAKRDRFDLGILSNRCQFITWLLYSKNLLVLSLSSSYQRQR